MPTTNSHNAPAVFSVLFLLAFGLHLSCARHGSQTHSPTKSEISTSTNAVNINTADVNELQRIPGIGAVYNAVKQIVATFGTQNKNLFNKVVLVEFPRKGIWTLGFLTNKQQGEPQTMTGSETWTVFVPTTPNPTSGFLIMLPRHEITELEMSVGDGMKMIISGGAVVPPWPPVPKTSQLTT